MVGRIYRGDLFAADTSSLPVGRTSGDANDNKLRLVPMTGHQLPDLLKTACSYDPNDNVPNIPHCVASGLRIRFAPWKAGKLISATPDAGRAPQPGGTFTVALRGWPFGTVCPGTAERVFGGTCGEILTESIRKAGTVSPTNSGRFALIY